MTQPTPAQPNITETPTIDAIDEYRCFVSAITLVLASLCILAAVHHKYRIMTALSDFQRPMVVIVGAGPVGLALAVELGSRSIPCIVLERNDSAGWAPRAKTTHTRTREHLRRWGIADRLADASPFGVDYPAHVHFVTRLAGRSLKVFRNALNCSPQRDDRYSEHGQWIPQYKLEQVLREHAKTLSSVRIEFGQEYLSFEQDEDAVNVQVRRTEDDSVYTLEAEYLVGADGARSLVRDHIGATMVGTYGLSRNYNVIFRAPGLAEAHDQGPGIMYWQINPDVPSLIGPMDTDDLWFFMPTMLSEGVKLTDAEAVDLIRRSTGIDLPYEILSSDEWVASRLLADRYSQARVFLTGDACHQHPPFGGFGMNMGIADSVDLGWKLAAVLQGWGGQGLLDSYELERRQAHEYVMDEAQSNHSVLPNHLYKEGLEEDTPRGEAMRKEIVDLIRTAKKNEFYALGVVLGYCYQDSPVIMADTKKASWKKSRDYIPSAKPGCLAPHYWLDETTSLYDEFGNGFTLLILCEDDLGDISLAQEEASQTHTPLKLLHIPSQSLRDLYNATRVLIRPDQHVAWRGEKWPSTGLLTAVTGRA